MTMNEERIEREGKIADRLMQQILEDPELNNYLDVHASRHAQLDKMTDEEREKASEVGSLHDDLYWAAQTLIISRILGKVIARLHQV